MSDIIKFNPAPIKPGKLGELTRNLWLFPRPTEYQQFCFRIAEKALNLPVPQWRKKVAGEGTLVRHLDELDGASIEQWILEASEIDEFAAMVMLDAIDFFCDCLRFLTHDKCDCFDSGFKRDFTKSIGGSRFVFRVPAGCELSILHDKFDEGNYGVGRVLRCHLSESFTHENWGLGHLAGKEEADYSPLGYFGVPCAIVPSFKRSPIDIDDERWHMGTVTATIPYQWIVRVQREDRETHKERLEPSPSDNEILIVADKAIEAVKARFDEWARIEREGYEA